MTSINAQLNLAVKASGKGVIKSTIADLDKLEKKVRKARDAAAGKGMGALQGPMQQNGNFFAGSAAAGAPGAGGRAGGRKGGSRGGGMLGFSANADLAASNLEKVASAGTFLLKKPIQEFFSLESSMARVASKMDVLSTQDFARLKSAAIAAGAATGYSSKEAADGLAEMAAAGFKVEQQIAALPAVLQLAKAGELDVGRATAVAASTMSQFGLKASDTGHIGDVLVAAANASVISVDDLAETLKYVGPIAHTAGISLEETAASAAVLGNAGIEASMAGTSLRAVIAAFAKQTPKARAAMASVGISSSKMAEGVHEPIKMLELLGKKLSGASEAKKLKTLTDVFGAPAAPGAASLMEAVSKIGEDGLTAIQRARQATTNANGQLERAAKILGGTGEAKLKLFSSQVSATAAEIGEVLAPTLLQGTETAKGWVKEFGAWARENPGMVGGLGKITFGITAIATASAATLRVAGATAPLWSGISSGAGLAAKGITGTVAGMERVAMLAGASQGAATAIAGLFAVPAAAAAGWWLGKELDSAIGKLFNLKGELASTEMAIRLGENAGKDTNKEPTSLDQFAAAHGGNAQTGPKEGLKPLVSLEDLAALFGGVRGGNAQLNKDKEAAEAAARQHEGRLQPGAPFRADSAFNAATGKLEVIVTDDRIKTKLSGNVGRLGQQEIR